MKEGGKEGGREGGKEGRSEGRREGGKEVSNLYSVLLIWISTGTQNILTARKVIRLVHVHCFQILYNYDCLVTLTFD